MKFEGFRIGKTNGWKPKIGENVCSLPKTNSEFTPENVWLENKCFSFLERPIFQLSNCFPSREGKRFWALHFWEETT